MAEGRMTADQKGHVAKRQAAAPAPSVGNDIKLPGGNVISRGRLPILTMSLGVRPRSCVAARTARLPISLCMHRTAAIACSLCSVGGGCGDRNCVL